MQYSKAIAKQIKAKGLQKTRFYCQVCEKQCRDENGFKCHTISEGHLRKMQLFSTNSRRYIEQYSKQFEQTFLDLLSKFHNTKRVKANTVYNELVQDREHVHLNSTQWSSLGQFVKYLGEEGKCNVDEVEGTLYIQWIDTSREKIMRDQAIVSKRKHDEDDEERRQRIILKQIEAAKASTSGVDTFAGPSEVGDLTSVDMSMKIQTKKKKINTTKDFDEAVSEDEVEQPKLPEETKIVTRPDKAVPTSDHKSETSAICLIPGTWLAPGLVVKVVTGKLGKEFRNQKGIVRDVVRNNEGILVGLVDMDKTKHTLEVKQSHAETVLPDLGGTVLIVSDDASYRYRGAYATLVDIDIKHYSATIIIDDVRYPKEKLYNIPYENICKIISK